MTASTEPGDAIDALAGLPAGSKLRAARPTAREYAQKSYEALLVSPAKGMMPLAERLAVACFVA
ncbi:MAG: CMD domain protein, partial [Variibacter sp.]